MSNTVQSLGKQLRSLVWHRLWKNVSVVNPAAHMGIGLSAGEEEKEEELQMGVLLKRWGPDPVHPSEAAYDQLAETLLERMAKASRAEPPNSCGPSRCEKEEEVPLSGQTAVLDP